jgi:tetratricopeptide (TPR) repeat protein
MKISTPLSLGICTLIVGTFACFRVPQLYTVWPDLGLAPVATFINSHDPVLFLKIGDSYFGDGAVYDIKKAEAAYTRAIELQPDFLEAHFQLGRIHFIGGRFESARIEMSTVLRIDPEFKRAYYMQGLISGYKGDYDDAIWGFSEFIKRDSFNWAGYNDLAWIYFKQGEYEKTRDTAAAGLKQAHGNPWLNNIYGTALLNLGEKEAARKALETALQASERMSPSDWGRAYPGNNPALYAAGLEETRSVIRHNLGLLDK